MTLPHIHNADNNPWPLFQHPDEIQSNELPHITTHIPFHIEFSLGTNETNPHHNPQDTTIVAISLWDENNPNTQTLTQTQYQKIHTWITQHLQPTLTKHNINPTQITTGPERPNPIPKNTHLDHPTPPTHTHKTQHQPNPNHHRTRTTKHNPKPTRTRNHRNRNNTNNQPQPKHHRQRNTHPNHPTIH